MTDAELIELLDKLGLVCAEANGICDQCRLYSNKQHGCFLKGEHALLLHKGSSIRADLINLKGDDY